MPPLRENINNSFKTLFFLGPTGHDFSIQGRTELLEPFLAKKIHRGTPQGPRKLKKSLFSGIKIFEKWHFLASKPPKIINIDR